MKRALIAIASVGILAPTVWVVAANAQYGARPPGQPPTGERNPDHLCERALKDIRQPQSVGPAMVRAEGGQRSGLKLALIVLGLLATTAAVYAVCVFC
jgi:hypothetical protein